MSNDIKRRTERKKSSSIRNGGIRKPGRKHTKEKVTSRKNEEGKSGRVDNNTVEYGNHRVNSGKVKRTQIVEGRTENTNEGRSNALILIEIIDLCMDWAAVSKISEQSENIYILVACNEVSNEEF